MLSLIVAERNAMGAMLHKLVKLSFASMFGGVALGLCDQGQSAWSLLRGASYVVHAEHDAATELEYWLQESSLHGTFLHSDVSVKRGMTSSVCQWQVCGLVCFSLLSSANNAIRRQMWTPKKKQTKQFSFIFCQGASVSGVSDFLFFSSCMYLGFSTPAQKNFQCLMLWDVPWLQS